MTPKKAVAIARRTDKRIQRSILPAAFLMWHSDKECTRAFDLPARVRTLYKTK